MTHITTHAIVLRRVNYGEADRIIQLLSAEHGIISVIAKGVRREKSKLAGGLELFSVTQVSLFRGASSLATLRSARLVTFYRHLISDYARLQRGYEVIKQVARTAETVAEPALYHLLVQSFEALNNPAVDVRSSEIWFWLHLADIQGVALNTMFDTHGQKLKVEQRYSYDVEAHSFEVSPKGIYHADHIKLLRLLSTHSPEVSARLSGASELLDDCLVVAQQLISRQ